MDYFSVSAQWYFALLFLGVINLPLTNYLLPRFGKASVAFSKAVGIIIFTYLLLFISWTHLISFSYLSISLALIIIISLNLKIAKKTKFFERFGTSYFLHFLIFETIFIFTYALWVTVRGQEPSIRGLEKFMDYGFMMSILKSKYFPPADMWLAGKSINYYYFGHMSGAVLTKLSAVAPQYSYNLILATLFALGINQAGAIGMTLGRFIWQKSKAKILLLGFLAAFLVNIGGNLHPLYLFTNGYPNEEPVAPTKVLKTSEDWKRFGEILSNDTNKNLLEVLSSESKYWYPNATRFIKNTIHEFPIYSYVVADLHGHVYDIPFVLLSLAIILNFFLRYTRLPTGSKVSHHKGQKHQEATGFSSAFKVDEYKISEGNILYKLLAHLRIFWESRLAQLSVLGGFLISVHYMTNAFDGPIYVLTYSLAILAILLMFVKIPSFTSKFFLFVLAIATLLISFKVFNFPFSFGFKPFVSGVGVNCGYEIAANIFKSSENVINFGPFMFEKGNCQNSPLYQLLILWGFFWFNMFWFIIPQLVKLLTNKEEDIINNNRLFPIDLFFNIIFVIGTFLLLVPEYFYIKDIYPTHFRANTMFKLGYQAFIIMSLASAYVLFRVRSLVQNKILRIIYIACFLICLFFISLYPYYAVKSFYGSINKPVNLDGEKWMKDQYPEYHEIVSYFNTKVKGQVRILEAQGDSYTDFNLISAYTGMPTVAGWWVHEWLWRGDSKVVGDLTPDIVSIYEGSDLKRTKDLLAKHKVKYFIIGPHEKSKYKNLNVDVLQQAGKLILKSKNEKASLYEVQ